MHTRSPMSRMMSGLLAARCSRVELELLVSPCKDRREAFEHHLVSQYTAGIFPQKQAGRQASGNASKCADVSKGSGSIGRPAESLCALPAGYCHRCTHQVAEDADADRLDVADSRQSLEAALRRSGIQQCTGVGGS